MDISQGQVQAFSFSCEDYLTFPHRYTCHADPVEVYRRPGEGEAYGTCPGHVVVPLKGTEQRL